MTMTVEMLQDIGRMYGEQDYSEIMPGLMGLRAYNRRMGRTPCTCYLLYRAALREGLDPRRGGDLMGGMGHHYWDCPKSRVPMPVLIV